MLWAHRLRLFPPSPPLIRLRLNVSCSARRTAADAFKSKKTATIGAPTKRGTKEKASARRRGKPIDVWVTDEKKAAITERADEAGMSRSGYLRALGLNTPIRSVADLTAVAYLAKVTVDLGQVAGLLKLWLLEKPSQGANVVDVELVMVEFGELQAGICAAMSVMVYHKRCESALRQLRAVFTGCTRWDGSAGRVADYVARSYAGKSILVGDASIRHGESTTMEMARDVCD